MVAHDGRELGEDIHSSKCLENLVSTQFKRHQWLTRRWLERLVWFRSGLQRRYVFESKSHIGASQTDRAW